jgi:hypothetical protein
MKTNIEERLAAIETRNERVALDKAWETSWTRRIAIACLTYIVVAGYLIVIGVEKPFVSGLVPPLGFVLSTLVLKRIREVWQKK